MVPERDVDPAEIYEQERLAFVALLRTRPETDLRTAVPATPAWSVRDVLAHLVGINADLNAQRFGDGGGDEWTAAQIASRRDASLEAMAAEWDREAPTFEAGLRLFGYGFGAHYLGDLLQHVGDVHAALGVPPARDDEPLAVALDFYLQSFEETVTDAHLGAVEVRVTASTGTETFTLGQGEVVATVTAPRWELFRSLGGRRTVGEIRALGWTGEADAVIPFLSRYPLPTAPLAEPRLNP